MIINKKIFQVNKYKIYNTRFLYHAGYFKFYDCSDHITDNDADAMKEIKNLCHFYTKSYSRNYYYNL